MPSIVGPGRGLRKAAWAQVERATMQPMAWDDFEVFLAVHRGGTHARAARALGVDPTTIGRRLATLEATLSATLFDRTPSGLTLTPQGRAVLPRAERMEEEVLAAQRELLGADARVEGTVRITAGDGFVSHVLLPALAELRRAHPGLVVEVRADTRTLDLSRREADVAVRLARPTEPALVARRMGATRFSFYASRPYLERCGQPRAVRELTGHEWVGFDATFDAFPQVKWLRRTVPELRYAVRANTTMAQVAACVAGHGIALLPTFVAPREPDLVPVLPRIEGPSREAWAVTHMDMRRNARVALVVEWLTRLLGGA